MSTGAFVAYVFKNFNNNSLSQSCPLRRVAVESPPPHRRRNARAYNINNLYETSFAYRRGIPGVLRSRLRLAKSAIHRPACPNIVIAEETSTPQRRRSQSQGRSRSGWGATSCPSASVVIARELRLEVQLEGAGIVEESSSKCLLRRNILANAHVAEARSSSSTL